MSTTYPNVAGTFYPSDADELKLMVQNFFMQVAAQKNLPIPKAIIAPHAGYIYSGPIAASAYACLTQVSYIKKVVVLAPAHRVAFPGIATLSTNFYATPLGKIAIDHTAQKIPGIITSNQAFSEEHALEVQLPFLQMVLKDFALIPLLVGTATPMQVAQVLAELWNGSATLIVISSDLSHYLAYHAAQILDNKTKNAILALNAAALHDDAACGKVIIAGLLKVAQRKNLAATLIDLRNSGDTSGTRDAVVGYGAFHLGEKK